jgi:2-dehydro-3-deoxyphosphogalactonate aldolase
MLFDLQAGAAPIIAILRGVVPERCRAIADSIYAAGIRIIEVPLNSPQPFDSIRLLREHCPNDCLIGAGTVLTTEDVLRTHAAGGHLIVAPNCNTEVVRTALQRGLHAVPGIATATEAFAALQAGTSSLKLFPAATYGPAHPRHCGPYCRRLPKLSPWAALAHPTSSHG